MTHIHAGVLLRYVPTDRVTPDRIGSARRLDHGQVCAFRAPQGSFLYRRICEDICDIRKTYEVMSFSSARPAARLRLRREDEAQV